MFSVPAATDRPLPMVPTMPPCQSAMMVPVDVMGPPVRPAPVATDVTVPPPTPPEAVRVPLFSVRPVPIALTVPAFQLGAGAARAAAMAAFRSLAWSGSPGFHGYGI